MPEIDGQFLLELLRARILKEVQGELVSEEQDSTALRKAMLTLIMMTQDGAGPAAKKFIEYLLMDFRPLADRFAAAADHPIFGKHSVGRRRSEEEGVILSLNRKLVDSILKKPVNAREMALIGNLVPWELTAERYVAFYDIMGFRSFVERHQGDHSTLHRIMSELYDIAVRAEEMHPYGGAKLHPALDHRGSQLRIIQFSDTILAMTRDASGDAGLLIQLVSQMFFCTHLALAPRSAALSRAARLRLTLKNRSSLASPLLMRICWSKTRPGTELPNMSLFNPLTSPIPTKGICVRFKRARFRSQ